MMKFHYVITLAAAAAAAPGQIADLESFPMRLPDLNATGSCQNRTLLLNTNVGGELNFSSSFHLSIALTGSLLLIFSLLWVKQHGYTLSERWYYSTDDIMWLLMGIIIIPWSILLPISTLKWDDCEGVYHLQTPSGWQGYYFWARMAFGPWLLDDVFLWWFIERFVLFSFRAAKAKRHRLREIIPVLLLTGLVIIWAAAGALHSRVYLLGLLNIAVFVLFGVVLYKSYDNPCYDTDNSHRYAMDDIRIPLLSAGQTGLAHVLPSVKPWYRCDRTSPFRLAITYSLTCEQQLLNDNKKFFEPMDIEKGWSLESCRASMNRIVTGLIANIPDDKKGIQHLASWLYDGEDPRAPDLESVTDRREQRPLPRGRIDGLFATEDFSLIGRDILLALQVWEQLVFDRRWQLNCGQCQNPRLCNCAELQEMVWTLREPIYTGAEATSRNPRSPTRGRPRPAAPLDGLNEAATEVYRILNRRPPEHSIDILQSIALNPPTVSITGIEAHTLPDYAGELWERCWEAYPSTLGALYLWTTVWYIDMGNRGFHTTPLLPPEGETYDLWLDYVPCYLTSWRIRWRYVWYTSILCQLVIVLPTVLSGFISLGI